MRSFFLSTVCIFLTACASGYKQFYTPYVYETPETDVQTLAKGETPKIFGSDDLQRDMKVAISKGYYPIGNSSFNGALESEKAVVQQAQRVGAVLVLVNSKFTESRSITMPLFLPNNQTNYSSGSVGNVPYSGTSTTYGSTVVPMTTQQQRYDQNAIYFVKSMRKLKFGLSPIDLPPELRVKLERNTGALLDIVVEDTPAFVANVLPGDVLIELDGTIVLNGKHAGELMNAASPTDGKCMLKIIRNGTERVIELQLKGS